MDLRQNVARNRTFSFVGLSLTSLSVTISKDGGAFAAIAGTLTNITGNFYKLALDAADTDTVGDLAYKFSDTALGVVVPNGENVDQVGVVLDVRLADAVAHGGTPGSSTATMAIARIWVSNPSGTAVTIESTGGDGNALELMANHYGTGMLIASGNAGYGLDIQGVATGVSISSNSGMGIRVQPGTGDNPGILISGNDAGAAVQLGDGSSGSIGLKIIGIDTSPAVQFGDGSSGAEALLALAGTGNTDADAIKAVGAGTGVGFRSTPDAVGFGGGSTPPTPAEIATAIFTDLLASSDFDTVASIGKLLKDFIDAAISSRTKPAYTQVSNVKYVNDVEIQGTGASGNEWGPS